MRLIESLDGELIPVPDMPTVPALADDEPLDAEDECGWQATSSDPWRRRHEA
jgi:hypothetical protein